LQKWIFDIRSRPFLILSIASLTVTLLVYTETTAELDAAVSGHFESAVGNSTFDVLMLSVTATGDVFNMLAFAIGQLLRWFWDTRSPKGSRTGAT